MAEKEKKSIQAMAEAERCMEMNQGGNSNGG